MSHEYGIILAMRKTFAFVILAFASFAAFAAGAAGGDGRLYLADPFVLLDGGVYYAYGTGAADGIPVAVSTNLVDWTIGVGVAKKGLALHKDDVWGERWFWAPEVYRRADGRYVMAYSAQERVCVAVADSPLGPFRQAEKHTLFEDDRFTIDNSFFTDDDGRTWMLYVAGGAPGYGSGPRIVEMEKDMTAVKKGAEPVFLFDARGEWEKRGFGRVNEGPFLLKHDGLYYITWSANDYRSPLYAVGCATSKSVTGPYAKNASNPILLRKAGLSGTGHHSFFRDREGRLRIVFHAHHSEGRADPRYMCIASADFAEVDGEKTIAVADDVVICRARRR